MFFSNKEDKLQLKAIDQNYAVIKFNLNGTVKEANKIFLDIMGYSLNEIVGKHHRMFCDKRFVESKEYQEAWDTLNKGKSITSEFKRIKKDGEAVFLRATYMPIVDNNGKIVEIIKLAQDITKRRLKDLYYLGQINAINKSQAVIEFDMNGIVINANKNFLNTLGYSLDEIVGKHHSIFCEESYKNSNEYKDFWKKLNSGQYDAGEYLRIGKDGRRVWIQASYNPILDLDGVPFKVVKYATDITLKKNTMFQIGKEIEDLTESLTHLKGASTTMVKEAKISMENSQETTVSIEELNQAVQELSKKIEVVLSSITNIADTTLQSEKIALEAKEQSKDTALAIVKLNEESTKIGDTINIITQIAFQTNILSLNAAVEAATAGEAGKGFAVVAQEVRNLATRSNDAAKDITAAIEYIQSLVKNSLDSIHHIDSIVEEISSMSSNISNAVKEQKNITNELASTANETSHTLNQITDNMVRVSNSASNTEKEAEKTKDNSNELIEISNKLIETLKVLN
ncbi:methyl-accepting chemotaxis protein [Arcobacter lacus]|uniref:Chemotaxis protein n=1 Tax=Arcobacter lacus TaxID=1912876 RepID=A0ABX5JLM3_9BACT|nr:PAS domain-containing methyl-accepting chemotaxis protein [Arcobacter lacus]PUE67557.1 chemotaxis protein [Arcobacter lacus]